MILKNDKNGIFYIMDYYPTRCGRPETREFLRFKGNEDCNIFNKYCYLIVSGVFNIISKYSLDKVNLVPIPRSSSNKISTIALKLQYIIDKLNEIFNNSVEFCNCTGFIFRSVQCTPSHCSNIRPTFDQQFNSMNIDSSIMVRKDGCYILLDDITTEGNTMLACEKHLLNRGITEERIIKFVVAKTIEI